MIPAQAPFSSFFIFFFSFFLFGPPVEEPITMDYDSSPLGFLTLGIFFILFILF